MSTAMDLADQIARVAELLRRSQRTLFITGAGLSADSGLPTYRGVGGLYENQLTEEGFAIEDALSGSMLAARPEVAWKYLWQIGAACRDARCNRGHEVIASIEREKPQTWVLTQNVDGLHRRAGSRNLIEIHGHAFDLLCVACREPFTADELIARYGGEAVLPPRCPHCGGLVRPDVVLFGEMLPVRAVAQLESLAASPRDLVVLVGTSALFPYIIEPALRARAVGVPTVEINPAETEISDFVEHCIRARAAEALDALWRETRD